MGSGWMPRIWTGPQRRALLGLLAVLWVALLGRWACNRTYFSDAPDAAAPRAGEVANRIDPNTADWPTLAAIPELGEKRAKAIVAYREAFISAGHGPVAFRVPSDLMVIKGIGPGTVANMRPYLIFPPQTQPTTRLGK